MVDLKNEFSYDDTMSLDENYLYQITQRVKRGVKKIALASGVVLLMATTPINVNSMTCSEVSPSAETVIVRNVRSSSFDITIKYQEPSSEVPLIQSLQAHKGNLMSSNDLTAFASVAKELGILKCLEVVCRWSSIHKAVSTFQKLENNIELRTTWFAEKGGKEVVFTIYHDGEEIVTSRSDSTYLVEQVTSILEKTKGYV